MKNNNIKKELEKYQFFISDKKIYRKIKFKTLREVGVFITNLSTFCDKENYYPEKITINGNNITIILSSQEKFSEKDVLLVSEINSLLGWRKDLEHWLTSSKTLVALSILFLLLIFWHYLSR